jgi:nucleoid-associated protein YgaU
MFAKALIVAVLAAGAVGGIARPSHSAQAAGHYTVHPGDTLWSIAAARYGGDTREAVWRIEQRNPAIARDLQPGDVLTLP